MTKSTHNYRFLYVILILLLAQPYCLLADPYPPYWENGHGAAIHYPPINWPGDLQWNVYTLNGVPIHDPRDKDDSNGGTSPQGYVNVSSGCIDLESPSVYWWFDKTSNMICFRWRVEQVANTYAVGPKAGAFSSSDPWSSALWTVFFDIDGDGYREFAMFLNGSSGSPSESIDVMVSVYSNTDSQSIDWETEGIYLLFHNPTAFVDSKTKIILNFQNTLSPIASWPNGKNETTWDYGSTRSVAINGCGEYYIDYQIPLDMFDATHVGGPKLTSTTPFSMLFSTANSLNNPLQKDLVYNGDLIGESSLPSSFGDMITFESGPVVQAFVLQMKAEGCQPMNLESYIRDAFDCSTGACSSSVVDVKFYGYFDSNSNGLPDDNNNWLLLLSGTHSNTSEELWTGTWDSSQFASGQYLIGAKATDKDGNTTWGFLSEEDVANSLGGAPNYANITPDPGLIYVIVNNNCGGVQKIADLSIEKSVDIAEPNPLDTIVYTLLLINHGPDAATTIQVNDVLPAGVSFVSASSQDYSPATGVWQISELASDSQTNLQLTITIPESSEGIDITNTAQIQSLNENDSNTSNNISSVMISVKQKPYLDLALQKVVNSLAAKPEDTLQYQIHLINNGPIDATNISIQDQLPDNVSFISSDINTYSPTTGLWAIERLPAGQTLVLTIQAQIIQNPTESLIINTASLLNVSEIDTNPNNNSASVQTSISTQQVSADLSIEKQSNNTLVSSNDMVCYTITALNNGPDTISDAYVIDQLPNALTYSHQTTSQGNYDAYSNIWNIGTLEMNQSATLILCAHLASGSLGEQIVNQAQVTSRSINDPYIANNYSETTIIRTGLVLRPNHDMTTTAGSQIVFDHDISIYIGNEIGLLSFNITSSQQIDWSFFYDSNGNSELDADDILWTQSQSVSSMSGKIFIRAFIEDYIPSGWWDLTQIQANLIVLNQTLFQQVTDITYVIETYNGEMHGIKQVAIDSNCNTQLDDEPIENQRFESSKKILPGECAIYRIHFMNQGSGKLSHIEIEDETPEFSTFIAGSAVVISTPQALTPGDISAPSDHGTGVIIWPFIGDLLPGKAGEVRYEVRVDTLKQ